MQSKNNNTVSDKPYLNLLQKVDFNPIFIMGDHRSGTTLLYKLLVATECFNFVKAYHIMKYDEILFNHINQTEEQAIQELAELFKSLGISNRTIDKVLATPNLPEEYGFIINNETEKKARLTPNNLPILKELCRKIQLVSDPDKPLLLKNPWDFPNYMYVKSVFPAAKFIFIHRNPIHIINSKLKAIRLMLSTRCEYTALISRDYRNILNQPVRRLISRILYSPYFNLALSQVTQKTVQFHHYYFNNIISLPKTDYISITYEELCHAPETTILKSLDFLNLKSKSNFDYESVIEPRPINLLPEVTKKYDKIFQKLEPYMREISGSYVEGYKDAKKQA